MESRLEYILTNSHKAEMIVYLKSHPEDFEEAIKLALSNKQPYSWRAAWLLWGCISKNDKRIQKHIEKIIYTLQSCRDNQIRELLIILQQMELDSRYEGKLFDICIIIWKSIEKKPSVRYHAFKTLIKIAKKHPDLLQEIQLLTESRYLNSLSDGVKRSLLKMISENDFLIKH
jgi:hypothetical protein